MQKKNLFSRFHCHHVNNDDFGIFTIGLVTECSCARAASSLRNSSKITMAKRVSVVTFFFRGFLVNDFEVSVTALGLGEGAGSS